MTSENRTGDSRDKSDSRSPVNTDGIYNRADADGVSGGGGDGGGGDSGRWAFLKAVRDDRRRYHPGEEEADKEKKEDQEQERQDEEHEYREEAWCRKFDLTRQTRGKVDNSINS